MEAGIRYCQQVFPVTGSPCQIALTTLRRPFAEAQLVTGSQGRDA